MAKATVGVEVWGIVSRSSGIVTSSSSTTTTTTTTSSIRIIIFIIIILMLLLLFLLLFFACKPWRLFFSPSRRTIIKVEDKDIERPLVSEDSDSVQNQSAEFPRSYGLEGASHQTEVLLNSPQNHGLASKQSLPPTAPQLAHSDSFVLDISEDTYIGQTLKRPLVGEYSAEKRKVVKEDLGHHSRFGLEEDKPREIVSNDAADQSNFSLPHKSHVKSAGIVATTGSNLVLEVISGPSRGIRSSIQSTNTSGLPLTLGRVSPSALLLKDSEVSGKHAMINWNLNKLKWELVDMGSLNGTFLNSKSINHANSESRHWGDPTELASGDIITLGTTSRIFVQITSLTDQTPFRLGMASDPMSLRRGGKKLPMEDVCYYQWPLLGADKFGLFGICDGHGGAAAAISASKLFPEIVSSVLGDSFKRERVLSQCDASDVLREAFSQTEACMNHYYEGCTATVVLIWIDDRENFYVQCANVGDSACFVIIDGKQIKMTEDHRITSYSERQRIQELGEPLKDGETRLCGLNLARMLGDKFLKQQDARFSSEPYISQVVYINQASNAFAVLASDGFWDVVNYRKAFQLIQEIREKNAKDGENSAEKIANNLLTEAKTQRTKDNTSIIFLDFDSNSRDSSCKFDDS